MFCKECGRELDDDELFCANCGARSELKEEEDEDSEEKTGKSKKVYISLIIGIVIALVFIAFIESIPKFV